MAKRLLIALGVVALVAAGCGAGDGAGSSQGLDGDERGVVEGVPGPPATEVDSGESGGFGAGDSTAPGGLELPALGPRVIKTADVMVEVERFTPALQDATRLAGTYGGFLVSSSVEGDRARRGSIIVRIPSDRFEQALAAFRDLGKVTRETVSGEDVGQEFVDLEARLRNFEAQEAVLLRLMDRAQSVSDTIKVQRELSVVQLEIEQITGRLRFLEDQTAMGTIGVALVEAGAPTEEGILTRAWKRAVGALLAVLYGIVVALGVVVPVGLLLWLAWMVLRRARPKLSAS